MKTLHGASLGMTLRRLSDRASKRVWIVSPYIGRWPAVSALLGGGWWLGGVVDLKVITDTSGAGNVHRGTLMRLLNRGLVKTVPAVHAKIYIVDDQAIITSANLTETGFTKRREIGILLEGSEATDTIIVFEGWWKELASELSPEDVAQLEKEKQSDFPFENDGADLPLLWSLPSKPDNKLFEATEGDFVDYQQFLKHYSEFAASYSSVQRLWDDSPLFLETDAFLNYLFHEADGTPSLAFCGEEKPRKLSKVERKAEIEKWAPMFSKWAKNKPDERWREGNSATIRRLLRKDHIENLTLQEVKQVVGWTQLHERSATKQVQIP